MDETNKTNGGPLPNSFSYSGKAARLLTAQEINRACGITVGKLITGELDTCNYLMENTKYSSSSLTYGYWLENARSDDSTNAWTGYGVSRIVNYSTADHAGGYGVRPAIEVPKSNIEY